MNSGRFQPKYNRSRHSGSAHAHTHTYAARARCCSLFLYCSFCAPLFLFMLLRCRLLSPLLRAYARARASRAARRATTLSPPRDITPLRTSAARARARAACICCHTRTGTRCHIFPLPLPLYTGRRRLPFASLPAPPRLSRRRLPLIT